MLSTKNKVSVVVLPFSTLTSQLLLKLFVLAPVGFLLFHLAVGIAAALQRLQRLLDGLRYVAVVDQAAPQVDDLVDVFDQQRTFFFAGAAGSAGPDFVFRVNAADQGMTVVRLAEDGKMLEGVVARLGRQKSWRQRTPCRVCRTIVGTASAIGAGIEVQHVLPGEVFKFLHAEGFHLIELAFADAPAHRLHGPAIELGEEHVKQRGLDMKLNSEGPIAQQKIKGQNVGEDKRRDGQPTVLPARPTRKHL